MPEEIKNEDNIEKPDEKATGVDQDKQTEKTFTQADVDNIVKSRVAREQVLTKETRLALETVQKEAEEKIKAYEAVVQKMVDTQLEPLPEQIKSLVKKLPLLDQIEWLSSADNQVEKRNIPGTPRTSGEPLPPKKSKIPRIF